MDKSRVLEAIRQGCVDPWAASVHWKDSPSPPPAPDYAGAAVAQGAANEQTARVQGRLNNPNIVNPYGSQTVTFGPAPQLDQAAYDKAVADYAAGGTFTGLDGSQNTGSGPRQDQFMVRSAETDHPTVTQTLNPEQQALLDLQTRISRQYGGIGEAGLGRIDQAFSRPLDVSGVDALQNKAEAAIRSRLDPVWNTKQQQIETQLRNQGLAPGGEAYSNAMRDFNFARNDADQQAILSGMQARAPALQEEIAIRNQPLAEVNALRTGSQPTVPQFQQYQGANLAPPPLFQGAVAQGQAGQNAYNAQVAQSNAFMGGLFGLGSAAIPVLF